MMNIKAGSTYILNMYYEDSDGTPIDISGWSARMKMRRGASTTAELVLDCGPYLTITGEEGKVNLTLSGTVTSGLSGGGVADCEIDDGEGFVVPMLDLEPFGVTPEVCE